MKHVQSLLALIQFAALCQIAFGWLVVDHVYADRCSLIMSLISDPGARAAVDHWFHQMMSMTRWWCICLGVVFFALATAVSSLWKRFSKSARLLPHASH